MSTIQIFPGAIAGQQHSLTTSRIVARAFDKQHKDVLRAIAQIECTQAFNERNFALVQYTDAKGEARPEYRMTRDGFMFLAMGFTGPEAARRKEAFITAFNAMEAELANPAVRPGQVEAVRLRRLAAALAGEVLRARPERKKLLRYVQLGLTVVECARLLGRGPDFIRRELALFEACGLWTPPPARLARRAQALANLGLVGVGQVRLERGAA